MKVYICDDNELDAERVRHMLAKYALRFGCVPAVKIFPGAEQLLAAWEDGEASPDLIFIDVYMGGMDGVQLLERLRAQANAERTIPVIFTTSSSRHAIEAFRLRAVGYLHKPYTQLDFDHAMKRIEPLFSQIGRTVEVLVAAQESGQCIYLRDIFYIESAGRGSLLHIGGESSRTGACARLRVVNGTNEPVCAVQVSLSMRKWRDRLAEEEDFCECGRSFIVNLAHAAEMTELGLQMEDGDIVPVPERLRTSVAQRLENWRMYGRSLSL